MCGASGPHSFCEWGKRDGLTVEPALRTLRQKMAHRRREFYEDRGARISILAGISPRPDTLAQTAHARPKNSLADGAGHTFFECLGLAFGLLMVSRTCGQLAIAHRAQLAAQRRLGDA